MVLTVSFELSPVIGLCCHRRLADTGVSGPLGLTSPLRDLTPTNEASGPHDFAVREPSAFVNAHPASTASCPASVTISSRPSRGQDGEGCRTDLGQKRTAIFLQTGLDDPNHVDPTGEFFLKAHPGGLAEMRKGAIRARYRAVSVLVSVHRVLPRSIAPGFESAGQCPTDAAKPRFRRNVAPAIVLSQMFGSEQY